MGVLSVVAGIFLFVVLFRKYKESKWAQCRSTCKMENKVVVITGANSGIGKETARDLARRGAVVVMGCRDTQAALSAMKEIRSTVKDGELIVLKLDLASLESVQTFAANLLTKFEKIDILINNAGIVMPADQRYLTTDGFEMHMGVNHLGHFYLTYLLLERIKQTNNSRIIIVSSMLYKKANINFDDLHSCNGWDKHVRPNILYSNSKLANMLHGWQLHKHLKGTGVSVAVLCPGFARTGLIRHMAPRYNWIVKLCLAPLLLLLMKTPKQTTPLLLGTKFWNWRSRIKDYIRKIRLYEQQNISKCKLIYFFMLIYAHLLLIYGQVDGLSNNNSLFLKAVTA